MQLSAHGQAQSSISVNVAASSLGGGACEWLLPRRSSAFIPEIVAHSAASGAAPSSPILLPVEEEEEEVGAWCEALPCTESKVDHSTSQVERIQLGRGVQSRNQCLGALTANAITYTHTYTIYTRLH